MEEIVWRVAIGFLFWSIASSALDEKDASAQGDYVVFSCSSVVSPLQCENIKKAIAMKLVIHAAWSRDAKLYDRNYDSCED